MAALVAAIQAHCGSVKWRSGWPGLGPAMTRWVNFQIERRDREHMACHASFTSAWNWLPALVALT